MHINDISKLLMENDNFLICAHTGPDGDAIGSVSALLSALRKQGKTAFAVLENFSEKYLEVPGVELIDHEMKSNFTPSAFISLDCANKSRIGVLERMFDEVPVTINIDHHISNDCFAAYNYIDAKASATAEIIYDLLAEMEGFVFDRQIASSIYLGILFDTGSLRHPTTTKKTLTTVERLLRYGIDFTDIQNKTYYARTLVELQMQAKAIQNIVLKNEGQFVLSSITTDEMKEYGAKLSDLEIIVDCLRCIKTVKIAAFIYQKEHDVYKISLRSLPEIDVNKIATLFGGGGHKNAAGATFCGNLTDAIAAISAEISKVFEV